MSYPLDITTEELWKQGAISVRTMNALRYAGLDTLRKVAAVEPLSELMNVKNLGAKSFLEISNVVSKIEKEETKAVSAEDAYAALGEAVTNEIEAAYQEMMAQSEYSTAIYELYPQARCLHEAVVKGELMRVVPALSLSANKEIRLAYRQFVKRICHRLQKETAGSQDATVYCKYEEALQMLSNNYDHFSSLDVWDMLSPSAIALAEKRYEYLCQRRLGVRARNLLAKIRYTLREMVAFLDKDFAQYGELCPGHNLRKALTEIHAVNQGFRDDLLKLSQMTEEEIRLEDLKFDFPYLSATQRAFVAAFEKREGQLPLFYLLLSYLQVSEDRNDKIFSLYYGIYDGNRYSMEEIAQALDFSVQRIQQIMTSKDFAEGANVMEHKDWEAYDFPSWTFFVTEHSTAYLRIKEEEHLECTFEAFAGLLSLCADMKLEVVNGLPIAVTANPGLKNLVNLKGIEHTVNGRYSEDTAIDIDQFAAGRQNAWIHGLLNTIFADLYGVPVNAAGFAQLKQNCVDVAKELYGFLKSHGKPLSIGELFILFKNKYPSHKFTESDQIRSYLLKHEHIRSVGKTGFYGLDEWTHVYFGTIRELLSEILGQEAKPIHISYIEEKVKEHYPDTNTQSLISSMLADDLGRFAQFDDGCFGLTSRQYDQEARNYVRRIPFTERMSAYRTFEETYHHAPLSSGGEQEGSLYRWQYNLLHGVLDVTDEQKSQLERMIEEFRSKGYPQTGLELAMLNGCEEYKAYVETHHVLPSASGAQALYQWFRKARENYDSYTDLRRRYLTDLFGYLVSLGFSV